MKTSPEILKLLSDYRTGSREAHDKLFEYMYNRLVSLLKKHFDGYWDEYLGSMYEGFILALNSFEEAKNTTLESWITTKVLSKVLDYRREILNRVYPRQTMKYYKKYIKKLKPVIVKTKEGFFSSHFSQEDIEAAGLDYEYFLRRPKNFLMFKTYLMSELERKSLTSEDADIHNVLNNLFEDKNADPEKEVDNLEEFEFLIKDCTDLQKRICRMFYIEGLTYAEIAKECNFSPPRSGQHLREALETIRAGILERKTPAHRRNRTRTVI
jgi:RNA polymerase sigma factor (sigma-70 family)